MSSLWECVDPCGRGAKIQFVTFSSPPHFRHHPTPTPSSTSIPTGRIHYLHLQYVRNVITLGQTQSDNINRMTTITGDIYLVPFGKLFTVTCNM
jgi:hypothetical protein